MKWVLEARVSVGKKNRIFPVRANSHKLLSWDMVAQLYFQGYRHICAFSFLSVELTTLPYALQASVESIVRTTNFNRKNVNAPHTHSYHSARGGYGRNATRWGSVRRYQNVRIKCYIGIGVGDIPIPIVRIITFVYFQDGENAGRAAPLCVVLRPPFRNVIRRRAQILSGRGSVLGVVRAGFYLRKCVRKNN